MAYNTVESKYVHEYIDNYVYSVTDLEDAAEFLDGQFTVNFTELGEDVVHVCEKVSVEEDFEEEVEN